MADKDNYPLIFHCWGGADRAGTVALLLEAVLGWSDEMILREYQWTSLSIWGSKGRKGDNGFEGYTATLELLRSYDTINGSLRKGAANYLRSIGVTDTQIQAIREIMLEPIL